MALFEIDLLSYTLKFIPFRPVSSPNLSTERGKVVKEENTLIFFVGDETRITNAGKDMPFAELKKGDAYLCQV